MPTLSLEEKEIVTSELYKTNGNCELPCWWGIVPGETDWDTVQLFLNTITSEMYFHAKGSESDLDFVVEVDVPVPEDLSEIGFLRHTFIVENGIIVKIELETPWGTRKIDTVSEILNGYGFPAEVWLDTVGYTFGEYYPFSVALFYPERGILVRYSDDAELMDDYLTAGCPQGHSGKLTLWFPKLELTFIEALGSVDISI